MFTINYKKGLKTVCDLITDGFEKMDFFEGEKSGENFDYVCLGKIASEIHSLHNLIFKNLQTEIDFEELSAEDYSEIQLMLNYIAEFIEEGFWDKKTQIIIYSHFSLINSVEDLFSISEKIQYNYSFTEFFIDQLDLLHSIIYESEDYIQYESLSLEKLRTFTKELSTLDTIVSTNLLSAHEKIKLTKKDYSYMIEVIDSIREWIYDIHTPSNGNEEIISTPLLQFSDSLLDLNLIFEIPREDPIIVSEEYDY